MSNKSIISPWDTRIRFKIQVTFIRWFTSCENSTYAICQGFSHYTLARTHYIDVHNRHFLHLAHIYPLRRGRRRLPSFNLQCLPLPFYPLFCNTTLSIILESNRHFLYPILAHSPIQPPSFPIPSLILNAPSLLFWDTTYYR